MKETVMQSRTALKRQIVLCGALLLSLFAGLVPWVGAQTNSSSKPSARPKLVVVLVVDQMRADYVEKFRGQWTGGLKRLLDEGAWFRNAAYPYAATETCVGHATIGTGILPDKHGIVGNSWWDRGMQKMVNCTTDPKAQNVGYAGISVKGGDSAARLEAPTLAEQMRSAGGSAARVVSLSLKARAASMLAGHSADAVTWFDTDSGAWSTSSAYGTAAFMEDFAKAHPAKEDYGKTWTLTLPASSYLYGEATLGAAPPMGWGTTFPHLLRGKSDSTGPDAAFYQQWQTSPFADTALLRMSEAAVDALGLGQRSVTDFLGVALSPLDYVGHAYGPHSREIQDVLVRLDRDLAELFTHLDEKVGKGNYVVAFSADHGVAPIPDELQESGADAGWLKVSQVKEKIEKALGALNYPSPSVARIASSDIYFAPEIYARLRQDAAAMQAVIEAVRSVPGVAQVYTAEELAHGTSAHDPLLRAEATNYFAGRSGDMVIAPKPFWPFDGSELASGRAYGTTHGTPNDYDRRVPILFMGWGIAHGEFGGSVTPADIAPTLASLCGVKMAAPDGHVLYQALKKRPAAAPRSRAKPSDDPPEDESSPELHGGAW